MLKHLLICAVGMMISVELSSGADSTLSKACDHAYLIQDDKPGLVDIDLQKRSCSKIDLSGSCKEAIGGVTLSNAGFILCAAKHAIWSYDPVKGKCVKVWDAPEDVTLDDLAYDPKSQETLVTGYYKEDDPKLEGEIYILDKDGGSHELSTRYGTGIAHPVFANDETLFFVNDGDLWMGFIQKNADNDEGPARTLVAYRCAPLALLVEENTSPASTGLSSIALSPDFVYGRFARMGGSGWGSVIRFKRPAPFEKDADGEREPPSPDPVDWKRLQGICNSIEQLEDDPCAFLCSAGDRALVFYTNPYSGSDDVHLVKRDGKKVSFPIKGLASFYQ